MSDEKKGKVFLISMTVIIVLLFLSQGAYPKYKAGKYEEEQKKIAAEQKKVDAKAEDYIEEYASQLQDKMRLAGVDDLIVTYDDLTDDIFKKYTSSEEVNYRIYIGYVSVLLPAYIPYANACPDRLCRPAWNPKASAFSPLEMH